MKRKRPTPPKDLSRLWQVGHSEDMERQERFSGRDASVQRRKMRQTAQLRGREHPVAADIESLPAGQVIQVYSLYADVEHAGRVFLCVTRKTLSKLAETAVVVGDCVRFRDTGQTDEQGRPEAVIEQVLPRRSVIARADSFKAKSVQPLVANADQLLVVASVRQPTVKWGLIDRMLVAALSGSLTPVICLNKVDLATEQDELDVYLGYYQSLGIQVLRTSACLRLGLEQLQAALAGKTTVLAGHSGVGKSSLLNALAPDLDLKVGSISGYSGKGRHTTTSARRICLGEGCYVVDTPGVKLFGLWNVTADNLQEYFPDLQEGTASTWRAASYQRILQSLAVR